jgi:hypothetical protein
MYNSLIISSLHDNAKGPSQTSSGHWDRHFRKAAVALPEIVTANRSSRPFVAPFNRPGIVHGEDEAMLIDSHLGLWAFHASNDVCRYGPQAAATPRGEFFQLT